MPTYVTKVCKNMQKQHRLPWDRSFNILTDSPNIIKAILRLLDKHLTELLKRLSSQKIVSPELEDLIPMQKRST